MKHLIALLLIVSGPASAVTVRELEGTVVFGDAGQTTSTFTYNLSTGTDPVWTVTDGVMNLSTGSLQLGGTTVAKNDASNLSAASTWRTALGLVIGTNVQAYDAELAAIAGLADPNADRILFWDDSAGAPVYLTVGTGLAISGTTLSSTAGFDATGVDAVTWSDGANASNVWTFDVSGTDPAITFGNNLVNVSTGALQVGGTAVALSSDLAGYLALAGGTMTGDINLGGNDLTNVGSLTLTTLNASSLVAGALSMTPGSTTIDADGEIAMISNGWDTNRDALSWFDGTAPVKAVATLTSDTPSDGQFPMYNSGGTITWETVSGSLADGDKGDITVASSGASWTLDDDTVDSAEIATGAVDGDHLSADARSTFIEKLAVSHTLSIDAATGEGYGSIHYVTAGSVVLTLPAAQDGCVFNIVSNTANVVTVDSNASDLIILDGTALDDGDSIDSPGAAGDLVTIMYYDATGWFAASNTWVDGGP